MVKAFFNTLSDPNQLLTSGLVERSWDKEFPPDFISHSTITAYLYLHLQLGLPYGYILVCPISINYVADHIPVYTMAKAIKTVNIPCLELRDAVISIPLPEMISEK